MSFWRQLHPVDLGAIDRELARPETRDELARLAAAEAYPAPVLARLHAAGLARLFTEDATFSGIAAVAEHAARVDGSLAITLGKLGLALLPSFAFATPAQLERVFARVRGGAMASLLLTEWHAGSDLLAGRTRAVRDGDDYVLDGDKDLINGGERHALLTVLARTREDTPGRDPLDRAGDFSMFVIEREAVTGVRASKRWRTLPCPGADISSVELRGVRVPADARLGDEGEGFAVVQRTLALSRGGVSALAAGAAYRAYELARAHAAERQLYGAPIAQLGAIADHLLRAAALAAQAAALSVKQARLVDAHGAAAAHYTACAKYACCLLAEQAVDEGRRVLGGRALLAELPYAQLSRDVLLYGVFDGSSHVMLEQIHRKLGAALADRGGAPVASGGTPGRLVDVARKSARPLMIPLGPLIDRLGIAPLAPVALALGAVAKRLKGSSDQGLLHGAADALARLEALVALHELRPAAASRELAIASDAALGWSGAGLAQAVDQLARRADVDPGVDLRAALGACAVIHERARAAWRELL